MTYQESIKPLLECSFGIASLFFFRTWYVNVIDVKLSKMCKNTVVLIYLRRICYNMAIIQHFIKSESDNYFNILTVFRVFLHLTMHKQPK